MAPRVIDKPTFDKIECSRCGQCCENITLSAGNHGPDDGCDPPCGWEGFWNHGGPLGLVELNAWYEANGQPQMVFGNVMWFGSLEPFQNEKGEWRYRCPSFQREADGTGTCTIYEDRPWICSAFPYGREVGGYDQCVWDEAKITVLDYDVVEGIEHGIW